MDKLRENWLELVYKGLHPASTFHFGPLVWNELWNDALCEGNYNETTRAATTPLTIIDDAQINLLSV